VRFGGTAVLVSAILGGFTGVTTTAHAEAAFCGAGSVHLMVDDKDEQIKAVAASCRPGDIIALPPGGRSGSLAAARLCDFSKSMPMVSGMLYCVMVAPRPIR
jgi:hypothetical protein